jgi:hypothetical protein
MQIGGTIGTRWLDIKDNENHLRFIDHLKLAFVAQRPPVPEIAVQGLRMSADPLAEYFP